MVNLVNPDPGNASWLRINSAVGSSGTWISSPDGTVDFKPLSEDTTATSEHRLSQALTGTASVPYSMGCYVQRAVGTRNLTLEINDGTNFNDSTFDLGGGVVGQAANGGWNVSNAKTTIVALGGGAFLCKMENLVALTLTTLTVGFALNTGTTTTTKNYTGDGSSGCYVAQFTLCQAASLDNIPLLHLIPRSPTWFLRTR